MTKALYHDMLTRFYYQGIWRDKITTDIDFPLEGLDMTRYISGPKSRAPYKLFGVSVSNILNLWSRQF